MHKAWNQVQSSLRARLGTQDYEIWILPIEAKSIGEYSIQLQVPYTLANTRRRTL